MFYVLIIKNFVIITFSIKKSVYFNNPRYQMLRLLTQLYAELILRISFLLPRCIVHAKKLRENLLRFAIIPETYWRETQCFNIKGFSAQPLLARRTDSSGRSGYRVRIRPAWRFRDPVIAWRTIVVWSRSFNRMHFEINDTSWKLQIL